jgi:hypothetical protein
MDPESNGKFWHAPSSTKELSDEYEYNEGLSPVKAKMTRKNERGMGRG